MTVAPEREMMSPEEFSRQIQTGTEIAETSLLDELAAAYEAALKSVAGDCARRFTVMATRLTAAVNPDEGVDPKAEQAAHAKEVADALAEKLREARRFIPPAEEELVPKAKLAAEIERRTRAIREQVVRVTVGDTLTEAGISFDIGGIFTDRILDQVGLRARDASASTRNAIRTTIKRAQDEGWTVPETAAAINEHIVDLAPSTATQLARTDLIGTSNASADAAAHMVFAGRTDIVKQWTTADDERVRPTHQDAEGQTVPMSHPFNVGGALLDYPGDPSGPDDEVCNCRCVVLYLAGVPVTAAAVWSSLTAAFDPAKHPHEPGGSPIGGRWAPTHGTSVPEMTEFFAANTKRLFDEGGLPEGGFPQLAKTDVAKKLAATLAGDPDWAVVVETMKGRAEYGQYGGTADERAAAELVSSWAHTSGDGDGLALSIQEAARAEFGIDTASPYTKQRLAELAAEEALSPSLTGGRYVDPALQPGLRKFVRAQYDLTQKVLAERGITEVQLYRGMKFPPGTASGVPSGISVTPITSNPLSSWTHDYDVAASFANIKPVNLSLMRDHALISMTVPANRILSTPFTGFGALNEKEAVVLGGDDDVFVWAVNEGTGAGRQFSPKDKKEFDNAWKGAEYMYGDKKHVETLLKQQRAARKK